MSVKEVLQSLVDDNMVDTERVGTSNYYWAFPSKALHARKRRLEELEGQVEISLILLDLFKLMCCLISVIVVELSVFYVLKTL